MAVHDERIRISRIYLKSTWNSGNSHPGDYRTIQGVYRAGESLQGSGKGARLLAHNSTQEPERGGNGDHAGRTTNGRRVVWEWLKTRLQQFGQGGKHHAAPHDDREQHDALARQKEVALRINALVAANQARLEARLDDE